MSGSSDTVSTTLEAAFPAYARYAKKFSDVPQSDVADVLSSLELLDTHDDFKFGVLLALAGQTEENDMFNNRM